MPDRAAADAGHPADTVSDGGARGRTSAPVEQHDTDGEVDHHDPVDGTGGHPDLLEPDALEPDGARERWS
ncbi:MAG: hypothetical protein ACK5CE_03520, partial [Actinomycetes bacterium]